MTIRQILQKQIADTHDRARHTIMKTTRSRQYAVVSGIEKALESLIVAGVAIDTEIQPLPMDDSGK